MFDGVVIRDVFGIVRDEAWLLREYGDVGLYRAAQGPGWRLLEIQENRDIRDGEVPQPGPVLNTAESVRRIAPLAAATLICKALSADGRPAVDLRIAWYWPDAPEDRAAMPVNGLPAELRQNRALVGYTNLNGDSGFAMGGGAYYTVGEEMAPHACWVHGQNSDVLFGLGMRRGTNHDHLDFVFGQTAEEPPQPPEPPKPPNVDEFQAAVLAELRDIKALLAEILDASL
jgi:hypothetical protein